MTTEDPANNFAPDTGKITAYRSSGGFGIRLDGGNGYSGAEISPYYDSLLVKVTCCDNTFAGACHKALRALSETRVRGVKTNISFITNILTNETFRKGQCYTKFIDETPELFDISESRNRGNKLLEYIGNIVVNDPQARFPQATSSIWISTALKPCPSWCWAKRNFWCATPPCATPTSPCWPPGCAAAIWSVPPTAPPKS